MTQENKNYSIEEINELLEMCSKLDKEIEEVERLEKFLIDEYHTNKRWFKPEGGRVTVEDIIKSAFEFGWSSRRNFDFMRFTSQT